MNTLLLKEEIQEYIKANLALNASDIALKKSPFNGVEPSELAQQFFGKQKAKKKFPSFFKNQGIYYPPKLNIEQTSSQETAVYKAGIVNGETLIDCTGGLGVDTYFFSKKIKEVVHCELNKSLQQIALHNFNALKAKNIISKNINGLEFAFTQKKIDWIYIDPSRRNKTKGKVFMLADCLPNVPDKLEALFEVSDNILIKTAPILDISVGMNELKYVAEIHVVALNNEVKELLWVLKKGIVSPPILKAVNFKNNTSSIVELNFKEDAFAEVKYHLPQKYLYEPYVSVMKLGVFNWVAYYFNVKKLHPNTHLYTSNTLKSFEGKRFEIIRWCFYSKKEMKEFVGVKANVVTKNFKLTVADLRKKHKILEGMERYLFFVTNMNNKLIVVDCNKID